MERKVIGLSLWGEETRYYKGGFENIELAREFYPGWEVWFYLQNHIPSTFNNDIISYMLEIHHRADKIIWFEPKGPFEGAFKRFLPVIEKDVDVFISRDCDSRINSREQAAVNEWLNKTKSPFHLMRDHKDHLTDILAGMWGCRGDILRNLQSMLDQWTDYSTKGVDQAFLTKFVWPIIKNNHLAHDSAYDYTKLPAKEYYWAGYGDVRPFPPHAPMRHGEYVGASLK